MFVIIQTTEGDSEEMAVNLDHCKVDSAVKWLAEKYDIPNNKVEFGMLVSHFATMALLTNYAIGNGYPRRRLRL